MSRRRFPEDEPLRPTVLAAICLAISGGITVLGVVMLVWVWALVRPSSQVVIAWWVTLLIPAFAFVVSCVGLSIAKEEENDAAFYRQETQ